MARLLLVPKKVQESVCTFVLPCRSFQIKNRIRSSGVVATNVFGWGNDDKKASKSCWSRDVCRTYGFWERDERSE